MAKRKAKAEPEPTLESLTALWDKLGLPEDAFVGDLEDACDDEAAMMFENIKAETIREQLYFLYLHGFALKRLEELINEYAAEKA